MVNNQSAMEESKLGNIDEKTVEVFIQSLRHFYSQVGIKDVEIGVPYLMQEKETIISDYTGIIGISGKRKGCVYYTCPASMLRYILLVMGEKDQDPEHLCDAVGEVANTISGNARTAFGSDFMISVPVVVQGEPERIYLPERARSIVIPTYWKFYQSAIVVALE